MSTEPKATHYSPDPQILTLADLLGDAVSAADFPNHILRFRNDRWDKAVGLDGLDEGQWLAHFGRFTPLPDNLPNPLALRYHGHQFRHYNPDIGDGRGFLFAQMRDGDNRLLDLGTKGSGQTPYSRFGDGKLTLKGGMREILATEMLEALGVNTSKTFSIIETGERLYRNDEPSPTRSCVMVRLSHSHMRIGTFQRLATLGDTAGLERVVRYCLPTLFGVEPDERPALQLLALVAERTAKLAASYMVAGFVHGVLNSDNINITGESFDYGPWRFTPKWTSGFTAAYFDQQSLYAFARQPQAIHWDVAQLAIALSSIEDSELLVAILEDFGGIFMEQWIADTFSRLGIEQQYGPQDQELVTLIEKTLSASDVLLDRFYFDWRGGKRRAASPDDALYALPEFQPLAEALAKFSPVKGALDHAYWHGAGPCSMHIEEVESLWTAIDTQDDWAPLYSKVQAIRTMGEAHRGAA